MSAVARGSGPRALPRHHIIVPKGVYCVSVLIGEVMKFFLLMALAMASSVCMSQITIPEIEKVLDRKPSSSESALAHIPPKTGYEKALPSLLDDQFVWDQFQHRSTLIWACRGSKTGKIVANSYCASQPMEDSRWPDKKTPEDYTGVLGY